MKVMVIEIKPYKQNNTLMKPDHIQLIIAINSVSSKDTDEECVMHSKGDNVEIMIYSKQVKL